MPLRVVPEDVGAKVHTRVPWQYPLIVPDIELPPIVFFAKAAFKFNVRGAVEVDEELPPQAANISVVMRGKPSFKLDFFSIREIVVFSIIFFIKPILFWFSCLFLSSNLIYKNKYFYN
ncbi:hypothetical protein DN92_03330 [Polynucleobacter arcticus]|uniref:Uncharacterized protein n=1 Tax=Polynucleobacter arcticus TaxID=1743165 RepID=A0A6M9PIA0_9BURK|nr:hypothetical protein DN92_03330 [Polynucleobacter arcticus]